MTVIMSLYYYSEEIPITVLDRNTLTSTICYVSFETANPWGTIIPNGCHLKRKEVCDIQRDGS